MAGLTARKLREKQIQKQLQEAPLPAIAPKPEKAKPKGRAKKAKEQ